MVSQGQSTAHGTSTRGVYFPRYQRLTSTSTLYEAPGTGYSGGGNDTLRRTTRQGKTLMMVEMRMKKMRNLLPLSEVKRGEHCVLVHPTRGWWHRQEEVDPRMTQNWTMMIRMPGSEVCEHRGDRGAGQDAPGFP